MLKTKNFGRKSLNEIKEILVTMGLGLGMKIDGWPPPGWDPNAPRPVQQPVNPEATATGVSTNNYAGDGGHQQ